MNEDQYLKLIGQAVYNYLGLQYGVTLLGNIIAPGLVGEGDIRVLGSIAHDFQVLAMTRDDAEVKQFAQTFVNVSDTFKGLLETTPFGAKDLNELGSSELNMYWDPDKVNGFLSLIATLQARIDPLTSKLTSRQ